MDVLCVCVCLTNPREKKELSSGKYIFHLFQGSAESNYSQQSSESLDGDTAERDREATTTAASGLPSVKLRDQTRSATDALERCKTKPVAFAVRTNIEYTPSPDDLCPIAKAAITFPAKEFLHIKDVRIRNNKKNTEKLFLEI